MIRTYIRDVGPTAQWGRSKQADLERLQRYEIAQKWATSLTVMDFVEHAETRRREGAAPTVAKDFVWIGEVLKSARPSLRLPVELTVLDDARIEMRKRKLIAKSRQRERRLLEDEETTLLTHFQSRDVRAEIPMLDIIQFALCTSRRQEEITRIKRVDLDRKNGVAWLDDVKHPRHKKGNRRKFRLLPEALAIIDRQPKSGELVFPYNPRSIGTAFRKACKFLGITNLKFHDLRHESTSRFFERGYAIQEVQQFTLHESWQSLMRYTHLKAENVPVRKAKIRKSVNLSPKRQA